MFHQYFFLKLMINFFKNVPIFFDPQGRRPADGTPARVAAAPAMIVGQPRLARVSTTTLWQWGRGDYLAGHGEVRRPAGRSGTASRMGGGG
jgi:hypothetical protein